MGLKIYALYEFLYIIKMGRVKQNYEHFMESGEAACRIRKW